MKLGVGWEAPAEGRVIQEGGERQASGLGSISLRSASMEWLRSLSRPVLASQSPILPSVAAGHPETAPANDPDRLRNPSGVWAQLRERLPEQHSPPEIRAGTERLGTARPAPPDPALAPVRAGLSQGWIEMSQGVGLQCPLLTRRMALTVRKRLVVPSGSPSLLGRWQEPRSLMSGEGPSEWQGEWGTR